MGDPVELASLVEGYRRAHSRFREALLDEDPLQTFIPLFEALAWAVTLDERLGYPDHPLLRGLRYARHAVHHQWAEALALDRAGFVLPVTFPIKFHEWRWRDDLPPPQNRSDERAYVERLAGQPARFTLDGVLVFLNDQL